MKSWNSDSSADYWTAGQERIGYIRLYSTYVDDFLHIGMEKYLKSL